MGEIAEGIISGDFDEVTGEYLGEGDGYPRSIHRNSGTPNKNKITDELLGRLKRVQKLITLMDFIIMEARKIDYGVQMRLMDGEIINVYCTGKTVLQGKQNDKLKNAISQL